MYNSECVSIRYALNLMQGIMQHHCILIGMWKNI